jgi:hypothetical protein
MAINSVLARSDSDSFVVRRFAYNCAICEAMGGDVHGWGNSTDDQPAFLLYLGCDFTDFTPPKEKVEKIINAFGASEVTVRKPKYLKEYDRELKIRGLERHQLDEFLYRFCCPF